MAEEIDSILVTAKNHQFASEATGLTLLEVHQAYQDAQDAGEICVLPATRGFIRNIFEHSEEVLNGEGSVVPGHRRAR